MTTASAAGRSIAGGAAPVRGLSVRRPGAPVAPALVPPVAAPTGAGPRRSPADMVPSRSPSEFYDEYLDSYGQSPPVSGSSGRTAEWAARNSPASRGRSSYAPSSQASVRRRVTKRAAPRRSVYEEEEEGYGSGGDFDEFEMTRIRVKVCDVATSEDFHTHL